MTTPRERLAALPPLSAGAHEYVDEGACFMEAVSYVAGEPWSDKPACACPVLGAFLRTWNDDLSDTDRDRLLRPLVRRLAGSRSTPEVEARRHWLAMDWLVRTHAPTWLRLTPALVPHADALTDLPPIVDAQTAAATIVAARAAARAAAGDAAVDAAGDAAGDAAWDAAWAAAGAAARAAAVDAARAAAGDAAGDAAWAAAWAAAGAAAGDAAGDAAWDAAGAAAGAAARAAAWDAAGDAARDAAWAAAVDAAGDAAGDAAWDAAGAAAGAAARAAAWAAAVDALQPTVATLQLSALDLVDRMLAETASE